MHMRSFGNTNRAVSEVGLGCWQFGGDWGTCSDDDALRTLAAAVEAGVTFLDTADVYGAGRSEQLIGRFLRERNLRGKLFVATKLGRLHGYPDGYTLDLFRRDTEDSLRRLGVDAIDLTQLHCIPTDWLARPEPFDWLRTLQKEGKIRFLGASVESMDEARLCLQQPGLASLQIIFNIFRQKPIATLFQMAKVKNVALIARLPLASGLLAGRFTKQTQFPPEDHRNYNRDGECFNVGETFAGLPFEKGVELADEVKAIFARAGLLAGAGAIQTEATMAQWAMRWILDYESISVIIPGAKDPKQARDNAAVSALPALPAGVREELVKFYEAKVKMHVRGAY